MTANRQPWAPSDDARLLLLKGQGMAHIDIGKILRRTTVAVKMRVHDLRNSTERQIVIVMKAPASMVAPSGSIITAPTKAKLMAGR